ncbi:hypothetical protein [Deinococcus terrestris]|uniref:hypothetical protein n=1 Tax=Deinococcus terrestris TaxID=2651870 RepID=UPI001D155A89|nr:hypothetical protein [Deinococcus terrestris]
MKKVCLLLALIPLALFCAPAGAQAATSWNARTLSTARYAILAPQIQGNPNLLSAEQRAGILAAMGRDSAGAIKRRYPGATIVADPNTPGVIKVSPVLVAPGALVPWAKLTARLDFDLPAGRRVTVQDQFGLLTLWQHQHDAANFLYDQLVQRLP